MESSGSKGRMPPVPQTSPRPPRPVAASRPVLPTKAITPDTDFLTTAKVTAEWAKEKGAYLKLAFKNPYNLSLLGGGLAASVLTLNPLIALATLGLEGI